MSSGKGNPLFSLLRNLLALVGLGAVLALGYASMQYQGFLQRLDPEAKVVYKQAVERFMQTLDPASAMVKQVRVNDGLTPDDVAESLKSLAVSKNLFFAGEQPFYKQVSAVTGRPYRYVNFFSFCDARIGAMMADYNNLYTAFMPCRIALVQDPDGTLWLQMMELDLLIHGGKPLPDDLKEGALKVRDALNEVIEGAARGEF